MRRVVVTGMGAVTPAGLGLETLWNFLFTRRSYIKRMNQEDEPEVKHFGAYIGSPLTKNFPSEEWSQKLVTKRGLLSALSICSVDEAINDANWKPTTLEEQERCGVVFGSSSNFCSNMCVYQRSLPALCFSNTSIEWIHRLSYPVTAGEVATYCNFRGPISTITNLCASGNIVIGRALRAIQDGEADVMVASASNETVEPVNSQGLNRMGGGVADSETPEKCCRPFDEDRQGTAFGAGSGAMVLEELSHALKRGAKIHCEVKGYWCRHEGEHPVRPKDDGSGIYVSMKRAVEDAGLSPSDIDHIRTHSTGTVTGDFTEAVSISRLFGPGPVISSCKPHIGHLAWASGLVESMIGVMAMKRSTIPPILTLDRPLKLPNDAKVSFAQKTTERDIKAVMINAMGFGGVCSSTIYGKYTEARP